MSKFKFKSLLCPTEMVSEEQLATDRQILAFDRTVQHLNRRGFLGGMGGAILAAALAGETLPAHAQTTTPSVVDVLNFALNLEYLEANFYAAVTTGAVLSDPNVIGSAGVAATGGAKVPLDAITMAVAQALAADELHHIQTLRSTITSLGGTPISQPLINLAAKGPVATQPQFLVTTRQFTAVGSAAYVGGSLLLTSNTTVLTAAAQILAAEGQHAGTINYLCNVQGVMSPAVDVLDVPPGGTPTGNAFTVYSAATAPTGITPSTALSPIRTPQQTLGIVYNVANATSPTPPAGVTLGGFFPMGVNGNVKST